MVRAKTHPPGGLDCRLPVTGEQLTYPTAADLERVHADLVAESAPTTAGVRTPAAIESALTYVSEGYFGAAPATLVESVAHLVRLLVADHPFVDGNKRTALSAAVLLCELNDHRFAYEDAPIRATLKRLGTDGATDVTPVVDQFQAYVSADPVSADRQQLRRQARVEDEATRTEAIRRLAARDRERHAETYERLATE